MCAQTDDTNTPSVLKRGADDGFAVGIVLCAIFLLSAYSVRTPMLSVPALVFVLFVPVMAYKLMRRDYLRLPSMRFFSALCMHGICMFFFGSLLLAAVMYVFMRYVQPDYLTDTMQQAIDAYNTIGTPQAREAAHMLQMMIDKHLLPSAISLAVTSIWSTTFFGSILSMILAWLVRKINGNKSKQYN